MTWAPVTMRWPGQATQWMDQLSEAQGLAGGELASTAKRLADLNDKTSTNPGPVGGAAQGAIAAGRAALADQMGEAPACLVVTPFQSGIGQGRSYQRFLSAPNLLQQLAGKLVDVSDTGRPDGQQHLEIEVQRSPAVQVVWPPAFTDLVLTSLRATLETQDESAAVVPERGRRAHGALIGALALVGGGAIVLGAVGLTDPEPSRPAETSVLTQTTLRRPAETLATTSTTTTTSTPSLDDCAAGPAGPGTTIAPEAADGCEPG